MNASLIILPAPQKATGRRRLLREKVLTGTLA